MTLKTHILWMGNQIAGSEMSQNRKKHIKSFVVVPDDAGRWLAAHRQIVRMFIVSEYNQKNE